MVLFGRKYELSGALTKFDVRGGGGKKDKAIWDHVDIARHFDKDH